MGNIGSHVDLTSEGRGHQAKPAIIVPNTEDPELLYHFKCTLMGPVQRAIRRAVREADCLSTPTQSEPFSVGRITPAGTVLLLGQKQTARFSS